MQSDKYQRVWKWVMVSRRVIAAQTREKKNAYEGMCDLRSPSHTAPFRWLHKRHLRDVVVKFFEISRPLDAICSSILAFFPQFRLTILLPSLFCYRLKRFSHRTRSIFWVGKLRQTDCMKAKANRLHGLLAMPLPHMEAAKNRQWGVKLD